MTYKRRKSKSLLLAYILTSVLPVILAIKSTKTREAAKKRLFMCIQFQFGCFVEYLWLEWIWKLKNTLRNPKARWLFWWKLKNFICNLTCEGSPIWGLLFTVIGYWYVIHVCPGAHCGIIQSTSSMLIKYPWPAMPWFHEWIGSIGRQM